MKSKDSSTRSRRLTYPVFLIGTTFILMLVASSIGVLYFAFGPVLTGSASKSALQILPHLAGRDDRIYAEGDAVQARYRLVNTQKRPLTVKEIRTSCSCMATVAEGGKALPIVLAPMSHLDVTITTTANPGAGLEQTYTAIVATDGEHDAPREYPIAMSFTVADVLKAQPPSLQIHEANTNTDARSSFVLFTYRDPRVITKPTIRVLGSDRIKVEIRLSPVQKDHERKTIPRYVVDVRVEPASDEGGGVVEGAIDIETPGEAKVTVPVSCSFRSDIRFQPSFVGAGGRPGEVVDREIFQEFVGEVWKDISVVSKPEGCEVSVSRFDSGTNRIRVKLPVLAADQPAFLVLASSDKSRSVRVPIRYQPEELP